MFAALRLLEQALQAKKTSKEVCTLLQRFFNENSKKLEQELPALKTAIGEYHGSTASQSLSLGLASLLSNKATPKSIYEENRKLTKDLLQWSRESNGISHAQLLDLKDPDITGNFFKILKYCYKRPLNK